MVHVQNTQGKKVSDGESIRVQPKTPERSNRNDEEVSNRLS